MFSFFKKKKIISHIRLSGVIGNVGKFRHGIEYSGQEETIIKAGTPLGQLIPLSEKKYEMVQREMNQQDHDWIVRQEHAYFSTFWRITMRKKVQAMYKKFWNR